MDTTTSMMAMSGMGAVGGLASGISQYKQGQSQAAAYQYNADVVLKETNQKMQASQQKYQALIGKQTALYAASGVDISSGSPLLIAADTALKGAEEQSNIKNAGTEQANLLRYYGQMAEYSGEMGGLTSFVTGLGKAGMGMLSAQKGKIVNDTQGSSTWFTG